MKVQRARSKVLLVLLLFLSLSTFLPINLYAQDINRSGFELQRIEQPEDVPHFDVEFVNLAAEDRILSRLIFKLSFVNDELQFIRFKKKFRADYTATVMILDSSKTEVDRFTKTGFIIAENFDETNSIDKTHSTELSMDLEPNTYNFSIELKDKETRRSGFRNGTVTLRDFKNDGLMISDIFAVDSIATMPKEPDSDSDQPESELYVYFEIYNAPEQDSIRIEYQLLAADNKAILEGKRQVASVGGITRQYIRLDKLALVSPEIRIKIVVKSKEESLEAEQVLDLSESDAGPVYANLDEAIEQLIHIAKGKELKKMKSLEGEAKAQAFEEFWKNRDPDPGTRVNEYRQEYYRRVKFANKRFATQSKLPGWKTEMGMVYIKLGPPNYVATSLNEYRTRYEEMSFRPRAVIVWSYYSLRRQVIFQYRITEYRIANYSDVFDLLNGEMVF